MLAIEFYQNEWNFDFVEKMKLGGNMSVFHSKLFYLAGFLVLLVTSVQASDYINKGDGTVYDKKTGLTWQQGEGGLKNWKEAMAYCENEITNLGGKSDWRLPKRMELRSIVGSNHKSPVIDSFYFPEAFSSSYWTSTTHVGHEEWAWFVGFKYGFVDYFDKAGVYYVRCVRGGKHQVKDFTYLSSLPVPLKLYNLITELFTEPESFEHKNKTNNIKLFNPSWKN